MPSLWRTAGSSFEGSGGKPASAGDHAHSAMVLPMPGLRTGLLARGARLQAAAGGPAPHLRLGVDVTSATRRQAGLAQPARGHLGHPHVRANRTIWSRTSVRAILRRILDRFAGRGEGRRMPPRRRGPDFEHIADVGGWGYSRLRADPRMACHAVRQPATDSAQGSGGLVQPRPPANSPEQYGRKRSLLRPGGDQIK